MIAARAVLAGLAGVAVALAARPAAAGSCSHGGGGSSGSSSSSSSSSGGGGSDSSSSGSSEPACIEVSDVVGHSVCREFGDGWRLAPRMPAIVLELAAVYRRFAPGFGASGTAGHLAHTTGDFDYRMVPAGGASDAVGMGTAFRLVVPTPWRIYVGGEVELGGVVRDAAYQVETTPTNATAGTPTVAARQEMYLGYGGVAGIRGRLGRTVIAAEVAGGRRSLQSVVDSQLGACEITDYHWAHATYVEPRVRLDHHVNPWLGVGAYAGGDLLQRGHVVGVTLSFHMRAFDRGW